MKLVCPIPLPGEVWGGHGGEGGDSIPGEGASRMHSRGGGRTERREEWVVGTMGGLLGFLPSAGAGTVILSVS